MHKYSLQKCNSNPENLTFLFQTLHLVGVSYFVKVLKSMALIIQRFHASVLPVQYFLHIAIFIDFAYNIIDKPLKNTLKNYKYESLSFRKLSKSVVHLPPKSKLQCYMKMFWCWGLEHTLAWYTCLVRNMTSLGISPWSLHFVSYLCRRAVFELMYSYRVRFNDIQHLHST